MPRDHTYQIDKDKKDEIWLITMTKAPTPTDMSKGQSDNTNNATKSSIKQRLRTDLGRSVGVTTATHLPTPSQQPCYQKDIYFKLVNKSPYIDKQPTAIPSGEVIKFNTQTA